MALGSPETACRVPARAGGWTQVLWCFDSPFLRPASVSWEAVAAPPDLGCRSRTRPAAARESPGRPSGSGKGNISRLWTPYRDSCDRQAAGSPALRSVRRARSPKQAAKTVVSTVQSRAAGANRGPSPSICPKSGLDSGRHRRSRFAFRRSPNPAQQRESPAGTCSLHESQRTRFGSIVRPRQSVALPVHRAEGPWPRDS